MANTGNWQIKYILVLFILIFSVYTVNSFFYDIKVNNEGYFVERKTIGYNETDLGTEKADSFEKVIFNIGSFLSFGNINNEYARIIINIFVTSCWLLIGYLAYSLVRDWIPFV